MNKLFFACAALFIIYFNSNQAIADSQFRELPKCVVVTHCIREEWQVSNLDQSFKKVVEAVSNTPRTVIVEQTDNFLHAEAKTKWRRYTDDLLVQALPEKDIIVVRSESRLGIGDNGVNKKRVDELAYRLTTGQLIY